MNTSQTEKLPSARQAYLMLLVGTLINLFVNSRWNIPLAAWLSGIFFLRFMRIQRLRGQKAWKGYLLLALATGISLGIGTYGIIPGVVFIPTVIATAVIGTLPVLLDRLLYWRFPGFLGTLVYPLAATSIEALNLISSPLGSWGASAYSQTGNLILMQLVSLTGIWGISLLINWFASFINWIWENDFTWPVIRRGTLIYAAVLAAVLVYGGARLALSPLQPGTVRTAGIVHELPIEALGALFGQGDFAGARQQAQDLQERYFAATQREAQAGAQIVIWPEAAAWVEQADEAALLARAAELARQEEIYLVLPMVTLHEDKSRPATNQIVIIDPSGQEVMRHVKYGGNFLEGTELGDGVLRPVETPFGVLSGVICWDADFPAKISQAGRQGVGLLVVPSRDWREIDPMHSEMAAFRAIENGTSLIRVVENGLSLAVDPYGRVLARTDDFTASEGVIVAQMPVQHVFTLYPLIGDLFAWLSMAGLAAFIVIAILRRKRRA